MSSSRINTSSLLIQATDKRARTTLSSVVEPFHMMRLNAGRPAPFFAMTPAYYYGNKTIGKNLLAGDFSYAGQSVNVGIHGDPWTVIVPSTRYASWLHSFVWINDLLAVGPRAQNKVAEKAASVRLRSLIDNWITHYGQWNAFNWDPEILVPRLWYWLVHWAPTLSADKAGSKAATRRNCAMRQLKYLKRRYKSLPSSTLKLQAAAVLALGGARLTEKSEGYLNRGLDWLDDEIEAQILPDGGHISRNPEATLDCLDILLTLDTLLADRGVEGSKLISRAIDRLTPMVTFFMHSDGALASFNGGGPATSARIRAVLNAAPGITKAFAYGPHTEYQRLVAGDTIIIMDAGNTPPREYDQQAHLAPLAFELSTDIGRLVVNCGWNKEQTPGWRRPMRSSAAHSTLTLGNKSPGQLLPLGWKTKIAGNGISHEAGPSKVARKEQDAGIWLEASHQGYFDRTGLVHRRRLFMSKDGIDIRGEDSLYVPIGHSPLSREERGFDIRFHFHPDVQVSLSQDQSSALLVQKGKAGWRFRTDKGPLKLEESVYLAEGHKPIKCQQLVITGQALSDNDGEGRTNRARWSFRKLESRRRDG